MFLFLVLACPGSSAPDAGAASSPAPPSRAPLRCCTQPDVQLALELTLVAQDALARDDHAELVATLEQVAASLGELALTYSQGHYQALAKASQPCEGAACEQVFEDVMDAWVPYLRASHEGDHELALAYDKASDAHFLVQGPILSGPYGSAAAQLSWGTREQARAFDAARGLPAP